MIAFVLSGFDFTNLKQCSLSKMISIFLVDGASSWTVFLKISAMNFHLDLDPVCLLGMFLISHNFPEEKL